MTRAIMVKERNGYYEIVGDADEDWDFVRQQMDRVERIESLTGWPPYTGAYRLYVDQESWTYFVEEQANA